MLTLPSEATASDSMRCHIVLTYDDDARRWHCGIEGFAVHFACVTSLQRTSADVYLESRLAGSWYFNILKHSWNFLSKRSSNDSRRLHKQTLINGGRSAGELRPKMDMLGKRWEQRWRKTTAFFWERPTRLCLSYSHYHGLLITLYH